MKTYFLMLSVIGLSAFFFAGCASDNATTTTTTDTRTVRERSSMYAR